MLKSEPQTDYSDFTNKENKLTKGIGNVIFECDNKLPSSTDNVLKLFRVIKKYKKDGKRCNFESIQATMKDNYNMNEIETRRCITSLYLDGVISILKDLDDIVFLSKLTGKRNYATLLREKIRLSFLTNICQMYIKMNLYFESSVSDFSLHELMNYFIQEDIKIQRVKISEDLLDKLLEKLCRSGYLNKQGGCRYAITSKAIKFGLRMEVFKKYSSDLNVERSTRQKSSKVISNKDVNKCNLISPKICDPNYHVAPPLINDNYNVLRDVNVRPKFLPQIISSDLTSFYPVNMVTNIMDTAMLYRPVFPVVMEAVPIFSQIIPYCFLCSQGANENGIILQCTECNVQAHVVCEQFFNCSRATRWCKMCRYSFQTVKDNVDEINLLCHKCLNNRQNSSDICLQCQNSMLETNEAIFHLESLELKECIQEILSNDQTQNSPIIYPDEFVPQMVSFVEMLNESEEIVTLKTEPRNPAHNWSVTDVGKWLSDEGYGPNICAKFRNEEIDGSSLLLLLETDLILMKVDKKMVSEMYGKIQKLK